MNNNEHVHIKPSKPHYIQEINQQATGAFAMVIWDGEGWLVQGYINKSIDDIAKSAGVPQDISSILPGNLRGYIALLSSMEVLRALTETALRIKTPALDILITMLENPGTSASD